MEWTAGSVFGRFGFGLLHCQTVGLLHVWIVTVGLACITVQLLGSWILDPLFCSPTKPGAAHHGGERELKCNKIDMLSLPPKTNLCETTCSILEVSDVLELSEFKPEVSRLWDK